MEYKKRIVDKLLENKMKVFGGVLITGPKSCGKTTTAKQIAKTVIEFQDEEKRHLYMAVLDAAPSKLLEGEKPILFDEWQDGPKILGTIRKSIDDVQGIGMYMLTGSSSNFVKTPHTGTGRISTLKMYPMSLFESLESNGEVSLRNLFVNPEKFNGCHSNLSIDDLIHAICRGGWPHSLMIKDKELQLSVAEDLYNQIYKVDINKVSGVKRNPIIARKILKSYSRNLCTLASIKTIFDDVQQNNIPNKSTVYSYLEDLTKLCIVEDVEAWCPAIRSKTTIRSSSKRNIIDPSIAVAALGLCPEYFNTDFKTLGFLFESLCIRDLKIYSQNLGGEISYYHDRYGLEADAVLHLKDGKYALIEFKLGENEIEKGAEHLCKIERLIKEKNKKETQCPLDLPSLKIIITGGEFGYKRDDGVLIIPIGCLKD